MPCLPRSVVGCYLAVLLSVLSNTSWAASSSGVVEALQKKYLVTQTTPDHEQVTRDGTTMSVQSAGVYSLPDTVLIPPENKVADGKVQQPSMLIKMTWTGMGSYVLQTGDKVYITKIDKKDEANDDLLRFTILTVNELDVKGQDAQRKFVAMVSFKFKKGYLDDSPPEDVEKAVEAVLAPDMSDSQGAASQEHPPAAPPPTPPAQAVAPPAPPRSGQPPTISIGESSTQVLQVMGMPLQMVDLGEKKTYIYKNMKIIFINDKVSDVQ